MNVSNFQNNLKPQVHLCSLKKKKKKKEEMVKKEKKELLFLNPLDFLKLPPLYKLFIQKNSNHKIWLM